MHHYSRPSILHVVMSVNVVLVLKRRVFTLPQAKSREDTVAGNTGWPEGPEPRNSHIRNHDNSSAERVVPT